ncbi:T9SS type A sorting domain-containing protein [Empedobacter brevis]|uniref:T9SS type A sorting domain-containing protein n=1 Tax=Empedobacter brevis TaxID=247 RepID=A0AAJ1V7E8_9FLAO|nr:T9SS type A sorting domain-containing protein [Empedobacter brevis]MDM1072259.1 T9SS type A sorting domain-containing protein [Empedobacter brevis]
MKFIYLLFLLISVSTYSQPSLKWEKYIKDDNTRIVFDATSTLDYGFVIGGAISSVKGEKSSFDFFIMKINEEGKIQNELILGEENNEVLYKVIQVRDGGFLLLGSQELEQDSNVENLISLETSLWIVKINSDFNIEWKKNISNNGNNIPTSIYEMNDGNYIISGHSINDTNRINYIYSIDKRGNINWNKTIENGQIEFVRNLNNNILVNSYSNNTIFFTILNQEGEEINSSNFEQESILKLSSLDVTENTIDLYLTTKNSKETNLKKIGFDFNLNQIREISLDRKNNHIITSSLIDKNGILFYGNQYFINRNNEYSERKASYVLELVDKNFKQTWIKEFSKENDNNLVKAFKTRDQSILLIGNSDKENNLYFLKLSEDNNNNSIQNIEVFPIPTNDYLNVIINQKFQLAKIKIFDMAGRNMLNIEKKDRHSVLNISNFPSGIYLLNIEYENESYSTKIIKK